MPYVIQVATKPPKKSPEEHSKNSLETCWVLAGELLDTCGILIGYLFVTRWILVGYSLGACGLFVGYLSDFDGYVFDICWVAFHCSSRQDYIGMWMMVARLRDSLHA